MQFTTTGCSPYLLRQLPADLGVAALDLRVGRLADVVQQPAALGELRVRAQLGGDDARQDRHLDGVRQHVLAVARAVLQLAQAA